MSASREVSVIIPSYNQPNALRLVLEALRHQTFRDFEVVITDDGSEPDTEAMIREFEAESPFPLDFVAQEDLGFRKAKALNNGIRLARGRHLLFLDGDCVAPRRWAERYVNALRRGYEFCVAGYDILTLEQTREISLETIRNGEFMQLHPWHHRLADFAAHWKQRFYILLRTPGRPHMLGGNWAGTRDIIERVNGFDEKYEGVGREDSDLRNRLINAGARTISLWHKNFVFHCHHDIDPRRTLPTVIRGPSDVAYYESRRQAIECNHGLRERHQPSTG
ncbi:MAG: glycosyltransferase [Planctomycetota bacterium]